MQTGLFDYIESLTIAQGRHAGKKFVLQPWEKRFLRGAFGGPGDAALSIARGNGKTTFCAAVLAASISSEGPLVETGAENVLIATSFDVGKIAFRHVMRFLEPEIEKHKRDWRVNDSANRASLENKANRTRIVTLGHEPRRLHGLAPRLMLLDELAQWEPGSVDAALAALETSRGKIPDAKALWIGTKPSLPDHPFSKALEGHGMSYVQVHAARQDDPPFRKTTWKRANPSLSHMPDLLQVIRLEAQKARMDPGALASFEALRLNKGVADVIQSVLLTSALWAEIEQLSMAREGPYIMGVDLGTSAAQSAVAAYWPSTGALDTFACFPEIPGLAERGLSDGVGSLYVDCAKRGELITAGARVSDIKYLLNEALERWGAPSVLVTDRWREPELRQILEAAHFPGGPSLITRGMGFLDGADDVRRFRAAALDGRLFPCRSLLLRSAMASARVVIDAAGNAKLAKNSQGGRRLNARDDAVAASILAVAEGNRRSGGGQERKLNYAIV